MSTEPKKSFRVHRFRKLAAFSFDGTESMYLDSEGLSRFINVLSELRDDIESTPFRDSEFRTTEWNRGETKE